MHYEIHRGLKSGQSLNTAQRTSSLFAEEPVVLGKVFRRGYPPIILTESQFELNKTHLIRLEKAGSIIIKKLGVEERAETTQPSIPVTDPSPPPPPQDPPSDPSPPVPLSVSEEVVEVEGVKDEVPSAEVTPIVEEVVEAPKAKKGKNK